MQTLIATRPVIFFIKGQQTILNIDCNDIRPDSQIIREYKHRRKNSLLYRREENKKLKLTKDFYHGTPSSTLTGLSENQIKPLKRQLKKLLKIK
jgi:hypothetical protein